MSFISEYLYGIHHEICVYMHKHNVRKYTHLCMHAWTNISHMRTYIYLLPEGAVTSVWFDGYKQLITGGVDGLIKVNLLMQKLCYVIACLHSG